MMAHAFNPNTGEAEAGGFLSSRTARAIQRNPVSKNQKEKKKKVADQLGPPNHFHELSYLASIP